MHLLSNARGCARDAAFYLSRLSLLLKFARPLVVDAASVQLMGLLMLCCHYCEMGNFREMPHAPRELTLHLTV